MINMKKMLLKFLAAMLALLLCTASHVVSQTPEIEINAGADQYLNWEESHTTGLEGVVSPDDIAVEWSCPSNPQVQFADVSDPATEVTFPRPGYYLLELTSIDRDNVPADMKTSDAVIINVFKPNSYVNRLRDLVNLMTVDEKIRQLTHLGDSIPRLGIPHYNYWSEALHGIIDQGVSSFPQSVALGASWDTDIVYRVASAISDEARVKNATEGKGLSYWSPNVNIARDPRWGRNEESYSEDPYLLSRMGVAFVKGMQGDHTYYLKTIATPKHFIANNEEIRRHNGSSDVDMRCLQEYYMQAFKSTIVEGKAYSIMGAYNELNHVPCCGNYYLMTDLLRRKWGFNGYVVSDCGAIHDMVAGHHFFKTGAEAAARGILAGCDLNCGEYYSDYLQEALNRGLVEEKDIDTALTRVLSARFRLGEFDPPYIVPYASIPAERLDCQEHRDLALEAAHKSIVLLKNDGILPLDRNKIKSIAVIGPNAEECQLGNYSGMPNIQVSLLDGIINKVSGLGIKVAYAQGCEIGGGFMKPIESKYFAPVKKSGKRGMTGEYFDNIHLAGEPVLTRIDTMVNFSWRRSPAPGVPENQFSVRWTGKIIPPETRTYFLGTRADDGARLYMDGQLLIEDWTEHGERPNNIQVKLEGGKEYEIVFEQFDNGMGASARLTWDLGLKDFNEAKQIAAASDVVILALGTNPGLAAEENDRIDISLPEIQMALVKEIAQVNPNIVIVLINGGAIALEETEKEAVAILEAWYTGQSSGTAIADVIFGDVNPGGKLPETFYASNDQLPPFADYDIINNGRTYMYFDGPVLYPFGYGLSYTTFEYSELKLNHNKISKNSEIEIGVNVKNTGNYKGDEVVQVYIRDMEASVKVPIHRLMRFQRITLEPNESKTVNFKIPASELSFYDIQSNDFIVEPGEFEIQIGSSSEDIRLRNTFFVE
jgi:beta-glucosidase